MILWTMQLFLAYALYKMGQVENAEVQKPKYGNGSMELELREWEETHDCAW